MYWLALHGWAISLLLYTKLMGLENNPLTLLGVHVLQWSSGWMNWRSLAERHDYIMIAHCWIWVWLELQVYTNSSKGSSAHEFGGWKPRKGGMFELQINFCSCRLFHVAIILQSIATNRHTQSFHRKLGTCMNQWENSTKQQLVAHMTHGGRTGDRVLCVWLPHFSRHLGSSYWERDPRNTKGRHACGRILFSI